jgi:hypothetical protein
MQFIQQSGAIFSANQQTGVSHQTQIEKEIQGSLAVLLQV